MKQWHRCRGILRQVLRSSSSSSAPSLTFSSSQAALTRLSSCPLLAHAPWNTLSPPLTRPFSSSHDAKEHLERKVKTPNMSVKQVLAGRPSSTYCVDQTDSVKQAINHMVTKKTSSSLILDAAQEIVGIVTARDLLRFVNDLTPTQLTRGTSSSSEALLLHKVTEVMTPVDRMIFCSPKDTVKHCREIM